MLAPHEIFMDEAEKLLGSEVALAIRRDSLEHVAVEVAEDAAYWYIRFRTTEDSKKGRTVFVDKLNAIVVYISPDAETLLAGLTTDERQQRATKHVQRAMVYRLRGMLAESERELEVAIQLDPSYAVAHNNLAAIRKQKGDYEGALLASKQAVRLNGLDTQFKNNLAVILLAAGRRDEALNQWWKTLEIDPKNFTAVYNLALAYGDSDGARALFCWEQVETLLTGRLGQEELKHQVSDRIRELKRTLSQQENMPSAAQASESATGRRQDIAIGVLCLAILVILVGVVRRSDAPGSASTVHQAVQTAAQRVFFVHGRVQGMAAGDSAVLIGAGRGRTVRLEITRRTRIISNEENFNGDIAQLFGASVIATYWKSGESGKSYALQIEVTPRR